MTKKKRPVLSSELFMEDYNSYESLEDRTTHRYAVMTSLLCGKERLNANDENILFRIEFMVMPKVECNREDLEHPDNVKEIEKYQIIELNGRFIIPIKYWDDLQFKMTAYSDEIENIPINEFFIDGHCAVHAFIWDWANVKLDFLPDTQENKPKRIPDEGDTLSPEDRFLWYMRRFIKKTKVITYEQLAERMVKYTNTKYTESTILNYVKHDLKA